MNTLILIAVVIILALVALSFTLQMVMAGLRGRAQNGAAVAYAACGPLMTAAERSFYGVLRGAVGPGVYIASKVRLADIIKPAVSGKGWQSSFNRISSKHIDFVLCDAQTMAVLCCIELDDASHQQEQRKVRDEFVMKALQSANVRFISIPAKRSYVVTDLAQQLQIVNANTGRVC